MPGLDAKLEEIASAPSLLVASDYDGTLSPIVSDPAAARPHERAVPALERLAQLPHTHVAVISGRALRDLRVRLGAPPDVHLIGSHGAELGDGDGSSLPAEARERLETVRSRLRAIAARHPGLVIEEKPAGIAFHYRNVPDELGEEALQAVLSGPARLDGVSAKHGKKVIELVVSTADKGTALQQLRHRLQAGSVLFVGDDVTDEDVFATLRERDLGIKVGEGATLATERIPSVDDVVRLLEELAELRSKRSSSSSTASER